LKYLSVCSGIEAASVAWKNLEWKPTAFAEVEPFPSAVLAHHYPTVINRGDMIKFKEWPDEAVDILVGGTPCQSFSIAGLRKGLADPRGNLMLTYLAIAERYRPKWIVWENVPGVLSSNGGRDFGTFLGSLVELGYGFAYRVLDAQWFGVAQRRRRVFVVGYLGNASRAAKVLFERESVCRNPAPSREKGQGIAGNVANRLRSGGAGGVPSSRGEHLVYHAPITGTLAAADKPKGVSDQYAHEGKLTVWRGSDNTNAEICFNHAGTLTCDRGQRGGIVATAFEPGIAGREGGESRFTAEVTGTLQKDISAIPIHDQATRYAGKRGNKTDGKGNGLGVGKPYDPAPTLTKGDKHAVAQIISFHPTQDPISSKDISHALGSGSKSGNATAAVAFEPGIAGREGGESRFTAEVTGTLQKDMGDNQTAVAIGTDCYNGAITGDVAVPLTNRADGTGTGPTVMASTAVRRLTPTECERLQGFPDGYTAIPWKKKPADQCPDGPRYKALGNSMAVPVMRWIGERINKVSQEEQA
jgi:DNA (cytosine-5)-methyltransferase 1